MDGFLRQQRLHGLAALLRRDGVEPVLEVPAVNDNPAARRCPCGSARFPVALGERRFRLASLVVGDDVQSFTVLSQVRLGFR